jgi:hypothetical protein
MVRVGLAYPELAEDVPHVRLDCLRAEVEAPTVQCQAKLAAAEWKAIAGFVKGG